MSDETVSDETPREDTSSAPAIAISRQEGDANGRYSATTEAGTAELTYSKIGGTRIQADHTFVPEGAAGQGIGGALVARMVEDARTEGRTILPVCSFVAHEFSENEDWADVLDAG